MNGFRIPRKKKLTAEQGHAMATLAATQQAFPALVGAKWALILSVTALIVALIALARTF